MDQLSIIIRYINEKGIPIDRYLCILPYTGHKAGHFFKAMLEVQNKYDIDIKSCREQSYDNTFNMSRKYTYIGSYTDINALLMQCSFSEFNW